MNKPDFTIHHVALTCQNFSVMSDFYEALGFIEQRRYSDDQCSIIHMLLGNFCLELFTFTENATPLQESKPLAQHLKQSGWQHIALKVSDLTAARKWFIDKLELRPSAIQQGRTGIQYFFIQDPEGNYVEVVQL
ncbi:VOC family protein [Zooshikella harenae]|uniref:VOC family protein n=1 Tax=Zooshikella harenae TaxID=2827238 RepID=A0ABS5ZAH7_9GAMM|nr:VOC family protein [Zooshikella harenae]MBU2711066.1 VOC family protein [Zooshikella harenae]